MTSRREHVRARGHKRHLSGWRFVLGEHFVYPESMDFWDQVEKTGGCWIWRGKRLSRYGIHRYQRTPERAMVAHRWAWIEEHGPIPEGLVLDHLCENTYCVRPDHLRVCTQRENVQRGKAGRINNHNTGKTRCPLGHEYSGVNKDGRRICAICRRMHAAGIHPRRGSRSH